MDELYWQAAQEVVDSAIARGSAARTVSSYGRGVRQLAEHLDATGAPCTADEVGRWLETGRAQWSGCKFKENRTAARVLLEALETGSVRPSPYSHPGPTDYSRLAGWPREAVDSYAAAAHQAFSAEEGRRARLYASQFFVRSGLEAAGPSDLTSAAVLAYVSGCGGAKSVRAARLSHLRGLLAHLHARGEAPAWLVLLASDRFASHADCYGPVAGLEPGDGPTPDECLSMADGLVGTMEAAGYSRTQRESVAKAVGMLCVALAANGARWSPSNATAWLESVAGRIGTQGQSYRRALDLFGRYVADGAAMGLSCARRSADPLAGLPGWAREEVASYLELRRREGCSESTLGCTRRACARLALHADAAGVRSWGELGHDVVAGWCATDEHRTAGGRACYVGKARGLLEHLADEGAVRPGLWLAARAEAAPERRVVEVLDAADLEAIERARLAAAGPLELRDAAIVALGLTMGLRSCDVVSLEMSCICWRSSSVAVVQRKTGAAMELPLTVAAGNALVAYLSRGRPASASPLVFVRHRAPYDGLTRSACRDALARTLGRPVGFHALRRTFATSMLRGGAGRAEVAEALGHRTELSTAPYLALDEGRMRACALPLGGLAIGGRDGR